MKRMVLIGYFLAVCFASSQNADVYFFSENDFLSGHSVLYQEVRYQSYLAAEYSDDHRLISLSYYDEEDQMRFVEKFIYLKTGDLQKKHVFNHQNTLTEETIYGKEENARRFIEFVMGVDAVKTWGDRYTKTYFRVEDGQPTVHEFYDVDGYYYGNIGFLYDEEGNRTEQIWIQYPSELTLFWFPNSKDITGYSNVASLQVFIGTFGSIGFASSVNAFLLTARLTVIRGNNLVTSPIATAILA